MADEGQLAALRQGHEAFRHYLNENYRDKVDLSGADLSGLDLSGINFGNANLDNANLQGCILKDARFNSASARWANFQDCDLTDTSFHRCDLTGSDFRGATGAEFGVRDSRLCVGPESFEGVRWDLSSLEYVLKVLNMNPDWEIQYEIIPKGPNNSLFESPVEAEQS